MNVRIWYRIAFVKGDHFVFGDHFGALTFPRERRHYGSLGAPFVRIEVVLSELHHVVISFVRRRLFVFYVVQFLKLLLDAVLSPLLAFRIGLFLFPLVLPRLRLKKKQIERLIVQK